MEIPESIVFSSCSIIISVIAGLFANNIRLENKNIKVELDSHKHKYESDLKANLGSHTEMWHEIRENRKQSQDTHDAVIELNASVKRLNEILVDLKTIIVQKVSVEQCQLIRNTSRDD